MTIKKWLVQSPFEKTKLKVRYIMYNVSISRYAYCKKVFFVEYLFKVSIVINSAVCIMYMKLNTF